GIAIAAMLSAHHESGQESLRPRDLRLSRKWRLQTKTFPAKSPYDEAVRALSQQQSMIDSLRTRAGLLAPRLGVHGEPSERNRKLRRDQGTAFGCRDP